MHAVGALGSVCLTFWVSAYARFIVKARGYPCPCGVPGSEGDQGWDTRPWPEVSWEQASSCHQELDALPLLGSSSRTLYKGRKQGAGEAGAGAGRPLRSQKGTGPRGNGSRAGACVLGEPREDGVLGPLCLASVPVSMAVTFGGSPSVTLSGPEGFLWRLVSG